ncbi:MAG: orotidine-5'-phosphate decarboxylase [Planctomycetota bacterium]|nr:orotidine-5'-phosphate decarboxylase [Planctomycetota bacterium]
MTKGFAQRLFAAVDAKRSAAMVGLDPRLEQLPEPFRARALTGGADAAANALREWHRALLDVIAPLTPAVKPQAAFFERLGAPGIAALADAVEQAHAREILVVMDAKRGDIGSTAEAYAEAWLGGGHGGHALPRSDALTVNPYLGEDACEPFLAAAKSSGAGLFFLVKTSNPGAGTFQDHGTPPLAEVVALRVCAWGEALRNASGWSDVGAVVGATRPEELARFRALMPHTPFLLPGYGAQGATAAGLAPAFDAQGHGAIVNASRSVLNAHARADLQHLSGWETRTEAALREMVEDLRAATSAPR